MRTHLLPVISAFLMGVSMQSSAAKDLALVCNEVNSIHFDRIPDAKNSPPVMVFNSDRLQYCGRKGNVLEYRKDECAEGNSVIRYDWITLQISLNDPPRSVSMGCVKR